MDKDDAVMDVECKICGYKQRDSWNQLLDEGWVFYYANGVHSESRCPECDDEDMEIE